jgi:NDP-sugar pyrophosphorylase family protein
MKVVVQCGGQGARLRPYTMILPKPLMPVGARPVLELVLKWLRRNGAEECYVTTGYLGELIKAVCRDGKQWDVQIHYTDEREPLGTIGPLSLLRDELDTTFLVVNGDVLTDLNLSAFVATHRELGAITTIATANRTTKMDFGVIEDKMGRVTLFKEKPQLSCVVSMGVYCMEPEVLQYVPSNVPFGFDDLMMCLMRKNISVSTYRHSGFWLDVGRIEDFQIAQELNWEDQPPAYEIFAAA